MTSSVQLPMLSDNGLSQYLDKIRKFPLLTHEEEIELANRWIDDEDTEAAQHLVTSHLRLVAKIAMGYRGYGLPVTDIISEGNVGLMHAVKRFDPDKGFRLSTYAMWWIKASINEYVLRSWSLVKIGTTSAQKKLFFNLKKMKNNITQADRILLPEEVKKIATDLNVSEREVMEMESRLHSSDSSLNTTIFEDDSGQWIDRIEDETINQEQALALSQEASQKHTLLENALMTLKDRERDIITKRQLRDPSLTLDDLSKEHGVSKERIRQIEARAMEKLKAAMLPSLPNYAS